MSVGPPTEYERLSPEGAARVDATCDRFEAAWRTARETGAAPRAETYLEGWSGPERTVLAQELDALDLECRKRYGTPARADDSETPGSTLRGGVVPPPGAADYRPQLPGLELGEVLGAGGMGMVFKARQQALDRDVAVKFMREGHLGGPRQRERFLQEARAVARLEHPHLVRLYEYGEVPGTSGAGTQPYLVLEYVSGCNLAHWLRGVPQSPREAAQLVETLADAIHYAHDQGVIHRDLKPANVLLASASGRNTVTGNEATSPTPPILDAAAPSMIAKITDFGLAKVESGADLTNTQDVIGTPNYMAPEQTEGNSGVITKAVDVYGLGAVLYEALTGRPPFRAATVAATIYQVQREEPVSPRRLQPTVPRDLETICLKCLQKQPGRRYATAQDLADDLRRFLAGEPIRARPISGGERFLRWCRRKPALAGLLLVVVLLVAVVACGGPIAASRIARQRDLAEGRARETREALWKSSLQQGRAERQSGQVGQRFAALEALARAAAIRPSLELRNEVIACLALPDLRRIQQWEGVPLVDVGVAFDHTLERYARVEQDAISVRQVANDREVFSLPTPGSPAAFSTLRFSPNGRYLGEQHRVLKRGWHCTIWDLDRRRVVLEIPCFAQSQAFAFSPDSQRVAIAQPEENIVLFAIEPAKEVQRLEGLSSPNRLAFDPTGKLLAISLFPKRIVELRSMESGAVVATFPHPRRVSGVAWGDGGRMLATGTEGGAVFLWDVATARPLATLQGHTAMVTSLFFNPAGNVLVSTGLDDTSRLWDPYSGRQIVASPGCALSFREDGRQLAFRLGEQLGVWDVTLAAECRTLVHGLENLDPGATDYGGPWGMDYSPDGRLLASCGGDGVRLWDPVAGRELAHLATGKTDTVLFHPSGTRIVAYSQQGIRDWTLGPNPAAGILSGPSRLFEEPRHQIRLSRRCCWSPRGESLALVANPDEGSIVIRPFEASDPIVELKGQPARFGSLAMSPDGRWLAAGAQALRGIQIWDVTTGARTKHLPGSRDGAGGSGVAFSPDGRWLVAGGQSEYRFWRVGSWEPGLTIPREHLEISPGVMTFTRDGRILAIAWSRQLVRLVDAASGRELATLTPPNPQPITQICFSPDEQQLAVATENRVIHVWDLQRIARALASHGLEWDATVHAQGR